MAGVAPWIELEGGALEALDRLLRLLRVLAIYQRRLGELLTPAQWRQRLLSLLDALLPTAPSSPNSQRALERLRKLLNQFADDAAKAGFDEGVPPEVVRAHFAAVLGEADTRAPLLTGGISFGRMVPMRLLPFRVICVLGLNDGDFPGVTRRRSQPAHRRAGHAAPPTGDRSTREDDRFLFLQLFAAAQEVFYLSYLGADPRDGSVREPSVLVSELIDAAAAYHLDPPAAARDFTVRHALQPFSPAAFGDGDPRRFSYRRQWHPAAGRLSGQRGDLQPWFDAPLPPPLDDAVEDDVALDTLRRFLCDPAGQFLAQSLGLRLADDVEEVDDLEPLVLSSRGPEKRSVQAAVVRATLSGDTEPLYPRLRARGLLPSGPLGERQFDAEQLKTRPYASALLGWMQGEPLESRRYEVEIDGVRLHGRVADRHPQDWCACAPARSMAMR